MSKPAPSARERLAVAARIQRGEVTVEGSTFLVRGLNSIERGLVLEEVRQAVESGTLPRYETPARFGLLEDDGLPMFSGENAEADAREFFSGLDGRSVEAIGGKVMELAGLKSQEAAAGNSPATRS